MTKQPQWGSATGTRHLRDVVQTLVVWIPLFHSVYCFHLRMTENTGCASRFLDKIVIHFLFPKNVMYRNYQKSALRHCDFKVPDPDSGSWLVNHEHCSHISEDASDAAGGLSKSHSPLLLPLRNALLLWLPPSLSCMLQRVKCGVSPSWPVRHNLLVRLLKRFSSLVKRSRRRNSLFTPLDCFSWRWLLLQCLRMQPYHTQNQETGWHMEDGSAERCQNRDARWCCTAVTLLEPLCFWTSWRVWSKSPLRGKMMWFITMMPPPQRCSQPNPWLLWIC